jgi:uncharacterized protein YunC (DUF1805 family)
VDATTLKKGASERGAVTMIEVGGRRVEVHAIALGTAVLVLGRTENGGVLGCGAIDPAPLERLGIPAARVRPTGGPSITNAEDLLAGEVRESNALARARGVEIGMSGNDALLRL